MTVTFTAGPEQPGELPFDPALVVRVEDDHGSHIKPPLDQAWPDLAQLAWCARVVEIGGDLPRGTLAVLARPGGLYDLRDGTTWSYPWTTYREILAALNGIARGIRVAKGVDRR